MKIVLSLVLTSLVVVAAVWAQNPAPAQQQAPQTKPIVVGGAVPAGFDGSAYRKAAELPVRIMNFTAQPSSVKPGEPVTLVWSVENPSGTTIEPELGRVMPRDSRQIFPKATTTFTLTTRGAGNTTLTRTVTVTVAGTTPVAAAVDAKKEVPRLANGKPDLSGVYGGGGGGGGARGGAPAGPVVKAGAEKFRIVRGPEDTGATANCMPLIALQSWGVPYQAQIIQTPAYMAVFHEYPGTFRIIPTDGSPHRVDPDPSWLGDSVGRWEGDTLIVDTIGFNDKTELGGYRHTEALHIVEKFTRTAYDAIQYEIAIEDPNVFEKPWVSTRTFGLRQDLKRIDEFICENNRDYRSLYGTK